VTLRLIRLARIGALCALALLAGAPAALAQELAPERAQPAPRDAARQQARRERIEAVREARAQLRREAPAGFEPWLWELRPAERRQVEVRLLRMSAPQRERWFREWSRLSEDERRTLVARAAPLEMRQRRELPLHLRSPELRERFQAMTPEQRQEFVARAQRWRALPPAERRRMRQRLERFGALGAAEQEQLVERRFAQRTPEERARILGELRSASGRLRARGAAGGEPAPDAASAESAPPPAQPPDAAARE
jgi:hypothetical protein